MSQGGKVFFAVALLALGLAACVLWQTALSNDKRWLLLAAHMALEGKRLYIDIFEINPPLILWMYMAAVWLSLHLPLADYHALALIGFSAAAVSVWLSLRLLKYHPAFAGDDKGRAFFGLLLAYAFVFFIAPLYFADREHLLLVLTFPYVLRFAPGLGAASLPKSLRLAVAFCAGFGFCMKPHSLVVFAAVQLLYLVRERRFALLWCAENIIIYAVALLYLALVKVYAPEYLHTVLPMAMATYGSFSRKADGLYYGVLFLVSMGVTFADFRPRHRTPFRAGVYYLLGICAAYLAYALLNNGWYYTYNPLLIMALVVTGWVGMEFGWLRREALAKGLPTKSFTSGIIACAMVLLVRAAFIFLLIGYYFTVPVDCDKDPDCRLHRQVMQDIKSYHARSFGVMSMEFHSWTELSRETGAHWDTRFNHLWMLAKLLAEPDFDRANPWIHDYVAKAYADDLNRWRPDIVLVDASPRLSMYNGYVDMPAYLSVSSEFAQAWAHYRHDGTIDHCVAADPVKPELKAVQADCRFYLYRRADLQPQDRPVKRFP